MHHLYELDDEDLEAAGMQRIHKKRFLKATRAQVDLLGKTAAVEADEPSATVTPPVANSDTSALEAVLRQEPGLQRQPPSTPATSTAPQRTRTSQQQPTGLARILLSR